MSNTEDQKSAGGKMLKAAIIYRAIVASLSVFLVGLAPFWDQHADRFEFGFIPLMAAIVAFYPLLLIVNINQLHSVYQLLRYKKHHYRRALLLDVVALQAILFGAFSTELVW